jgi:hypothetical protein
MTAETEKDVSTSPVRPKPSFRVSPGKPLYPTPEGLFLAINEYFDKVGAPRPDLDESGEQRKGKDGRPLLANRPPTITGLVLFLGFSSIASMYDYSQRGEEFSAVIAYARTRIGQWHEEGLSTNSTTTGHIFALKNILSDHFQDKSQQEHTGANGGPIQTITRRVVDVGIAPSGGSARRLAGGEEGAEVVDSVSRETSRISDNSKTLPAFLQGKAERANAQVSRPVSSTGQDGLPQEDA